MPKHIKRKIKTFKGAETRAKLTLAFWDLKNMKSYIHWTSDSDKFKRNIKYLVMKYNILYLTSFFLNKKIRLGIK